MGSIPAGGTDFISDDFPAILALVDEGKLEEFWRRNLTVAEDSHRMLRAMRRSAFFGGVFRVIWWALIIGVPIVIYYLYLQPIVEQVTTTYGKVEQSASQIQNLAQNLESIPEPLRSVVQSFLKQNQ